jgi:hypothetical protein
MYVRGGSPDICNTIIWGNAATEGSDLTKDVVNTGGSPGYSYSIIGGSRNADGSWNGSIGRDKAHNKAVNPFFLTDGLQKDGLTLHSGDYRLHASSAARNTGATFAVVERIYTPWDIILQYPKRSLTAGLLFDLDYKSRIEDDEVDIGAYEHGAADLSTDIILREIHLPEVEGLTTNPSAGICYVTSHQDFAFTVRAKSGYSLQYLSVTTGIPVRDREGIKMEKNTDGSVTVTILSVWEPLDISINGISSVSNGVIQGHKLWAKGRNLYIGAMYDTMIQIYGIDGTLHVQQTLEAGETVIPLSQGFYTVVIDGKVHKIMLNH